MRAFDFYITGTPRSGTAWLSVFFSGHPKMVCHHEPLLYDEDLINRASYDSGFGITGGACPSFIRLPEYVDFNKPILLTRRAGWRESYANFIKNNKESLGLSNSSQKTIDKLCVTLINEAEESEKEFEQKLVDSKSRYVIFDFDKMSFSDLEKFMGMISPDMGARLNLFIQMKYMKITTTSRGKLEI